MVACTGKTVRVFFVISQMNSNLYKLPAGIRNTAIILAASLFFYSCSVSKIHRVATPEQQLINDSSLLNAHIGIAVYDPATGQYLHNYQGHKYFVPASNTKIPTAYAAMKFLGDSIPGLRYAEANGQLFIKATADPTLLHRDYARQPVFEFLRNASKPLTYVQPNWMTDVYGNGWSWNDFSAAYMAERSELPIYGNTIIFTWDSVSRKAKGDIPFFVHAINEKVDPGVRRFRLERRRLDNIFDALPANSNFNRADIPFRTYQNSRLLEDTLKKAWLDNVVPPTDLNYKTIYSQHLDSVLKPLMHRSDNFFAEQMLIMAANELLGTMNEDRIIDTLLKTDFKDLPHRPRWADGSGLSRYNLFTPQSFVHILNKMKNEFGMDRIKEIFPTGNDGTLRNYYTSDSGYIYAKTGTLSGVVALSGFLYTQKGKLLLFSVLVNNHQSSAPLIRRKVEQFLQSVRNDN